VQIASGPLLAALPPVPAAAVVPIAHPLAANQMAGVEATRAVQQVIAHSFVPRVYLQTAFFARGSGASPAAINLGGWNGLAFDTPNWAIGVTVNMPLFDWFSLRERGRIEAQNERAELAAYDRIVQELSTQVAQAHAEMDGARRVAENTPIQLASARVLEQQSRARYDAGLAAILEVAESQRLLLQAEVGDAVARLSVWRALVAEAAATGDLSGLVK
jgi:outer membrane protein TolC